MPRLQLGPFRHRLYIQEIDLTREQQDALIKEVQRLQDGVDDLCDESSYRGGQDISIRDARAVVRNDRQNWG